MSQALNMSTKQTQNEVSQKISAAILAHVALGKSTKEAVDAVLGAGTYVRVAGEIYETLRVTR